MRIHEDAASADQQRRQGRGKSQSLWPQMEVEEDEENIPKREVAREMRELEYQVRRAKRTDGDLEFEFCRMKA